MTEEIKEIKEIIDNLIKYRNEYENCCPEDILTIEDVWLLLDYITNLQQELETKDEGIKAFCEDLRQEAEKIGVLEFKNQQLQQENICLKAENKTLRSDFKNQVKYATNFRKENERLKDLSLDYQRVIAKYAEEKNNLIFEQDKLVEEHKMINEYLKDYKSRLEKAIEYIENNDDFDIEIFNESTGGCLGTDLSKGAKNLLNILNGGDKE